MRHNNAGAGVILLMSWLAVTSLLLLTAVSLSRSTTELAATNRFVDNYEAFHLAEAAMDDTLKRLGNGTISSFPASFSTSLPTGTSQAQIENPGGSNTYVITATGTAGSVQEAMEAVVNLTPAAPSAFTDPLAGDSFILVYGRNLKVDSYDSRKGLYNPATPGTKGTMVCNSALFPTFPDPAVEIGEFGPANVTVYGQVLIGPHRTPPVSAVQVYAGSTLDIREPAGSPEYDSLEQKVPMPEVPLPASCASDLTVASGAIKPLPAGVYCYERVFVEKSAQLIPTTGQVTVYTRVLQARGSSVLGDSLDPRKLSFRIFVRPGMTSNVSLMGGDGSKSFPGGAASFYGTLYSPKTYVSVSRAEIYGAIFAERIAFGNIGTTAYSGGVHYDEAVREISYSAGAASQPTLVSWRTLD